MKSSYVVFGLGRFGQTVATELYKHGVDVMVIDKEEERINSIASSVTVAIVADICNKSAIANIGLETFDGAIVCMADNLESGIMAVMLSKKAGIKEIWAKAKDEFQGEILRAIGATKVVIPEREHAISVARGIASGLSLDLIELSDMVDMVKLPIPKNWVGKTLIELSLRQTYGVNVIAIEQDGYVNPDIDPTVKLQPNSLLFFVANRKNAQKVFKDIELE